MAPTQTLSVAALHLNVAMQPSVTGDVTGSPGHLKKSGFHRNASILSLNHNKHMQLYKVYIQQGFGALENKVDHST